MRIRIRNAKAKGDLVQETRCFGLRSDGIKIGPGFEHQLVGAICTSFMRFAPSIR